MHTLVFDANVPWDLDIKVNRLDEIMHMMNNIQFKIYMSSINFNEMPYPVRRNLEIHRHVVIDEPNQDEYDAFRREIRQRGIILDAKDSAMLYTSNKIDADYIISSDTQVRLMAEKYAENYGKKVKPFHLIGMFSFLRGNNMIDPSSCIKMSLKLYKNKEIPQMVNEYGTELISDKMKRNKWIGKGIASSVDTFNSYEQHIIGHLQ